MANTGCEAFEALDPSFAIVTKGLQEVSLTVNTISLIRRRCGL